MPRSAALATLLCLSIAACNPAEQAFPPTNGSGGDPVAQVAGREISQAELDAWLKEDLWKQQVAQQGPSDLYDLRAEGLERMISDRLLEAEAKRRGATVQEVLDQESSGSATVADVEVDAFYLENQARLGDANLEDLKPRIRAYLSQQRQLLAVEVLKTGLRDGAEVTIFLEPPRIEVAATGPALGPENAPITIVEFSDYECPFCQRAEPTIKQVLERYGEKVRLVFRHYPLSFHANAKPAAEAAACANDQGKFWAYHERLFTGESQLTAEGLEAAAGDAGLDVTAFKACVGEGRRRGLVEADILAGEEAGVDGTPAFFVNGIRLSGAQPLEAFVRVIDAELARGEAKAEAGS